MTIPRLVLNMIAGWLVIAGLGCGRPVSDKAPNQEVPVHTSHTAWTPGKITYGVSKGLDTADLVFDPETSDLRFLVRHGGQDLATGEAVSAAGKMELLRSLLLEFFRQSKKARQYNLAIANYVEVAPRLWNALAVSKEWNLHSGRPVHGGLSSFLQATLNQSHAYSELAETMAAYGYEVEMGEVSKIVVLAVREFPPEDRRTMPGYIKPKDKLPFTWSEYFVLTQK